ncbi:MAG: hypothetical protein ACRD0J_16825 [Acidimicrobiales bacterium]
MGQRVASAGLHLDGAGDGAAPPVPAKLSGPRLRPRAGVSVHQGDTITLDSRTGPGDSTQSIALLPKGQTAVQAFAAYPPLVADPDPGGSPRIESPAVFVPSDRSCGVAGPTGTRTVQVALGVATDHPVVGMAAAG